ncbi:hypothetical protein [Methylobacterium sp. 17Sr1-1]|uniref:hypothetical protein n=1 Tax=Methylobacterium sp. 17Sr1-1 TaxID=2202826 RepID=UPI0013A59C05|nr:hypothetical protein [Methylobacterium sp. 17Sr1-1]
MGDLITPDFPDFKKHDQEHLPPMGPGGTSGGMNQIWAKLEEHDKRFDRLETQMQDIAKELSNAKFWFVGTALAIALAGLGLVYSARQDTTATIGAALTAIQTAVAVRPSEPTAPQQPIVIVVPPGAQPVPQQPTGIPASPAPQAPK